VIISGKFLLLVVFWLSTKYQILFFRIVHCMRRRLTAALLLVFAIAPLWAVDGTFQGRVIDPPQSRAAVPGWIYVQGANHMLRRVEVAHAEVVFADNVPVNRKRRCNMDCLSTGQEVRITAEQDKSGEWRAKRVEILQLTAGGT
jgi:hypothetical protein